MGSRSSPAGVCVYGTVDEVWQQTSMVGEHCAWLWGHTGLTAEARLWADCLAVVRLAARSSLEREERRKESRGLGEC